MAMPKNQKDRAEWYDRTAELPEKDETKIKMTSKASGMLSAGFTKLDTPADKTGKPQQLASTRDRVGSKWPGPKGRVGTVLHGKSSPYTEGDCVHVAPNREFKAK